MIRVHGKLIVNIVTFLFFIRYLSYKVFSNAPVRPIPHGGIHLTLAALARNRSNCLRSDSSPLRPRNVAWDNAVMPLVRIDLRQGKPPEYRRKIGDMVYRAMRETINMPEHDRFQVITDHPAEGLVYDPSYLGI
jgi:hypothetical protein